MLKFSRIGRIGGVTFRGHWSLLLLALGVQVPYFVAAYVGLIILHEMGHALLARRAGGHVESIDLHILGGICRFSGVQPKQLAFISTGGLAAQLLLFAVAAPLWFAVGATTGPAFQQIFGVAVHLNAAIFLLNALPVPPLDGSVFWPHARDAVEKRRVARTTSQLPRQKPNKYDIN